MKSGSFPVSNAALGKDDDAIAGAEQKIVATLRRTGEEQELSEEEQVKLLVKLQESARRPDLRRVGRS